MISRVPAQADDQQPGPSDENDKNDEQHQDNEEAKMDFRGTKSSTTDHLPPSNRQNVAIVFGCQPANLIDKNTQMVHDTKNALEQRFDKKTLTLEIPKVFEFLKGQDANFELTTSSTLQTLELPYRDNIVAKSHALVFQTDELSRPGCKTREYTNSAENGELAVTVFEDYFKFDKVELIQNPSKQEVLTKIEEHKAESDEFEQNHDPKTVIALAIVWVGFKLSDHFDHQIGIMKQFDVKEQK